MDTLGGLQIIQEIVSSAISAAPQGWNEFIINYHVDDEQSEFANSYLITLNHQIREKPLHLTHDLDSGMRRLRAELASASTPPFTSCKLWVKANGKFEASYGYGPVDWDELVTAGWNFPEVTNLH